MRLQRNYILYYILAVLICGCSRNQKFTYVTPERLVNSSHTKHWIYIGSDKNFSYLKRVDYELKVPGDSLYPTFLYRFYEESGFIIPDQDLKAPNNIKSGDRILLKENGSFELDKYQVDDSSATEFRIYSDPHK